MICASPVSVVIMLLLWILSCHHLHWLDEVLLITLKDKSLIVDILNSAQLRQTMETLGDKS